MSALCYAIVPSRGCYGAGSTVRALRVCADKRTALRLAAGWTVAYRREMARHGRSSGGYRVVTCEERRASWIGHDLDREPGVT